MTSDIASERRTAARSGAKRGTPAVRRRGRRPGPNKTREAILHAARTCFARDGYAGTTIRQIAEDAGVDASLVMQFYGTKEELFGVWEGEAQDAEPMLAMLRSAVSNEQAATQLRGFLQARLTAALGAENALRVGIASSMLVGLVVGRDIVRVPSLVEAETESLVVLIAPALQAILAGGRPLPGGLPHRPHADAAE